MIKIRIGGWAGQGTVLAGRILATSLALEQGMNVVQKRSYSAAVRSGISYSDIIADEQPLDELVVDSPDHLIVLYQKTLDEWKDIACRSGRLIVDTTRVADTSGIDCEIVKIPAGTIAQELGTSKAANMVLLGALAASSEVDLDSLKKTVSKNLPERYRELNLEALQKGYEYVVEGKP